MTKRVFDLEDNEGTAEAARDPSTALPLPTLDERAALFLRALHGKRNFTNEEHANARERILDAMAADILSGPERDLSTEIGVAPGPFVGPKALGTQNIHISLSSKIRFSTNAAAPSKFVLHELEALELLAACHSSGSRGLEFVLPPAYIPPPEKTVAAPRNTPHGRLAEHLVRYAEFVGIAAIVAAVAVFIGHSSWFTAVDPSQRLSQVRESPIEPEDVMRPASPALVRSDPPGTLVRSDPPGTKRATPYFDARNLVSARPMPSQPTLEEWAERLKFARELFAAGKIPAARYVLQPAAEAGSAAAALELGTTYDPNYLAQPSVSTTGGWDHVLPTSQTVQPFGSFADIAMARAWYEKAKELRAPEAQGRLERLNVVETPGTSGGQRPR
jgi:hypothetical protein